MSSAIPINRLRETANLIAFHNPQPSYPVHIIIMPKRVIHRFIDLTPADNDLLLEIVKTVQGLVDELQLQEAGYRLIVNGGKYQTVFQLHFHLVSGDDIQSEKL